MKLNDNTQITKELAFKLINIQTELNLITESLKEFGRITHEKTDRILCDNISTDLNIINEKLKKLIE